MKIPYGKTVFDIDLPDFIKWQVLEKDVPFSFPGEEELVKNGVNSLSGQLKGRLSIGAKILLIVPDHTRKCNLPLILPSLTKRLQEQFGASIDILIANGSHVLQPESVVRELLGPDNYDAFPVAQHDAKDESQLADFGSTSYGTEIRLNTKIKEADFIITISGILFHYFAGFGGGPKMLLPGVAAYETIRQNHSLTIDCDTGEFHPDSREGDIAENPVYRDLSQVLEFVPNVLSLQVVLSPQQKIVACKAGPIVQTQEELIPQVKALYGLNISEKADIVIASPGGFPADVNLIQAHKSIRHACHIARKNGTVIFFAQCIDGVGSKTFLPSIEYGVAAEIGKHLSTFFQINGQTALSLKEMAENYNILFISELQNSIVSKVGMTPCRSWEDAVTIISQKLDAIKIGYVMPRAAMTVPL